jgi:hypothetical protein
MPYLPHRAARALAVLALLAPSAMSVAACTQASAAGQSTTTTTEARVNTPLVPTTAASVAVPSKSTKDGECPDGMVLVEGEYCPGVEQKCLRWLEPPGDKYEHYRCAKYAKPATCKGPRVHRRFCIDERERTEPGTDIPVNRMTWSTSKALCEADGARLCMTSEWQFACEGEEMRPYAYGWERDATACNVDVMTGLGRVGQLVDHRAPASAHPRCVSPFGVHDMAGNVDEWATVDGQPAGTREVMKGSWWLPGKHACRNGQGGHGATYGGTESGTRCCKDATTPAVVSQR